MNGSGRAESDYALAAGNVIALAASRTPPIAFPMTQLEPGRYGNRRMNALRIVS